MASRGLIQKGSGIGQLGVEIGNQLRMGDAPVHTAGGGSAPLFDHLAPAVGVPHSEIAAQEELGVLGDYLQRHR